LSFFFNIDKKGIENSKDKLRFSYTCLGFKEKNVATDHVEIVGNFHDLDA
jgi:hypothetical protein